MTSENFDTVLNSLREFRPYRVFTVELNGGMQFKVDLPGALVVRDGVAVFLAPGMVGFPGLNPDTSYDVRVVFPTATLPSNDRGNAGWIPGGFTATGRFLAEVGLPMPILNPEQGVLIHLVKTAGA